MDSGHKHLVSRLVDDLARAEVALASCRRRLLFAMDDGRSEHQVVTLRRDLREIQGLVGTMLERAEGTPPRDHRSL